MMKQIGFLLLVAALLALMWCMLYLGVIVLHYIFIACYLIFLYWFFKMPSWQREQVVDRFFEFFRWVKNGLR